MIKVNLATRKQAVSGGEGRDAGGGKLPGFLGAGLKVDVRLDDLKELPIKKIALLLIVAVVASNLSDTYQEGELKKLDDVIAKLSSDQSRLRGELGKTKGYESVKKQLEADETTMRTKIDTIQKLLADRQTPPKMIMTLSSIIPSDVWLNSIKVQDNQVTLRGAALSYNQISDFMKALNESAYFSDVNPSGGVHQEKDPVTGQDVNVFELGAKRR